MRQSQQKEQPTMSPREQRDVKAAQALRVLDRELRTRANETDQAEKVIFSQREDLERLERELAECKDADKPTRPTGDEPDPPKPPATTGGKVRVQVSSSRGDLDAEFGAGNHAAMAGELPMLVSVTGARVEVCPANPFRGAEELNGWAKLSVNGGDVIEAALKLTGGRIAPFYFQLGDDAEAFGTWTSKHARPEARKVLEKGRFACEFGTHNGVEVAFYNTKKGKPMGANFPSGAFVYDERDYWFGHPEGRKFGHRLLRGIAARMSIFRCDEDEWRAGRIEFDLKRTGYYGGCGTDQLEGYTHFADRVGGEPRDSMDDLDQEHFERAGVCDDWARLGDNFALLVQEARAVDVWHRWGEGSFNSDQLNRAYGNSLLAAVADGNVALINRMVSIAAKAQRPDGHIYFIPQGSDKWDKKIKAKWKPLGFNGPEECLAFFEARENSGLVIAFEAGIVCHALEQAYFSGCEEAGPVYKRYESALTAYPNEVEFPDNPYAGGIQGWLHLQSPWAVLGNLNLGHLAQNNPIGDGPCACAPPSLWPALSGKD